MILASQSQKDPPKLVQSTAQVKTNAIQMDSSAFDLLLAFVNGDPKGSNDGAAGPSFELAPSIEVRDAEEGLLADQAALAAKIADWFALNPASLSALAGLAIGVNASTGSGLSEALSRSFGGPSLPSDEISGLLENLGGGGLDSAARGVALVSAIGQASDSQSVAAALMAAVNAGLGSGSSADKSVASSNWLSSRDPNGTASLVDALSLTSADKGVGGAFANGLSALNDGQVSPSSANAASGASLGSRFSLDEPLLTVNQQDSNKSAARLFADEQKQRQTEQGDALLSSGSYGVTPSVEGLQQAMSAQNLGRSSVVNANALEGTVSWLASQQGGSATIDLSPPELGSLRLELKIDAGGESAVLIVHAANDAAKAAIEQSLDRLYESFQSSGMALQVSVGSGSSQFAGMFSNEFNDRSRQLLEHNRVSDSSRTGEISASARLGVVMTDALSLYA